MTRRVIETIHIGCYKKQSEIVNKIKEAGDSIQEVVRGLLLEYGKTHFPEEPLYAQVQKERLEFKKAQLESKIAWEKMSPEDYTINILRGRVAGKNAIFMTQGIDRLIPLSEIKAHTPENDDLLQMHQEILDETYLFDNGLGRKKMDPEWFARRKADYEAHIKAIEEGRA